jgi:hypothetical protein
MEKQRRLLDNRGVILIISFLVIVVLSILSAGMITRLITESRASSRYKELTQAFYLAESAVDKAIAKLPSNTTDESSVNLAQGQYSLDISEIVAGKKWSVKGYGYIPDSTNWRIRRIVEAFLEKQDLNPNFWDNAIYTAGDITLKGGSYTVDGDVIYAGNISPDPPTDVTGSSTSDTSIAPLVRLDYAGLRSIASNQVKPDGLNNLYTQTDIDNNKAFPGSFWFTRGDDGVDDDSDGTIDEDDEWVPNVVYVETDLVLNGNVGTMGGFIIVVGDVVTNPGDTADTTINGNGEIDGCVYSTGEFTVNGGGGGLNVLGGVWSGSDGARLNGNVTIQYNQPYMDAIKANINPSTEIQMISWREVYN